MGLGGFYGVGDVGLGGFYGAGEGSVGGDVGLGEFCGAGGLYGVGCGAGGLYGAQCGAVGRSSSPARHGALRLALGSARSSPIGCTLGTVLSDWLPPAGPAPFAALPFLPQQPPGGAFGLHGAFPAPTGEGRGLKEGRGPIGGQGSKGGGVLKATGPDWWTGLKGGGGQRGRG